ncbi:MAG: phosphate transport system regulatory protein PhoU [Bdellovibrionales bacterium RIFOXYB1_FULL_37_110]|nr:MAG: phosphate transport system regulatory protein PhoU [Bdellovibrionales bacterium RIFOXYC1_FULL_37_79]OFZ54500.1 MAG: phosphate transport system regulatory protein PhoU [Bdellovibrionales bacterium RIFOXYB2_FULL_36_6]OFZ59138.1 MAG: phosphate transport system regulatory protein PhoU [Bdellovibrionales bacterium RIFOXYB1_FULL_37_110]OFZ64143.1 MAG: phosphate transport system regulatory protein PhoU [Bdellovibrionales bacterium RIFOXYD1_FULL_36_51]
MDITPIKLKESVLKMAELVETNLRQCLDAKVSMQEISHIEDQINKMHKGNDDQCYTYLALAAPHAKDLRVPIAVLKINCDLERMGDIAISIKRSHQKLRQTPMEIELMYGETHLMANNAFSSFEHADIAQAEEVIRHDEMINQMETKIIKSYLELAKDGKMRVKDALRVIDIAKNLERLGDHATNIAEDLIFLESGKDIRHTGKLKNF